MAAFKHSTQPNSSGLVFPTGSKLASCQFLVMRRNWKVASLLSTLCHRSRETSEGHLEGPVTQGLLETPRACHLKDPQALLTPTPVGLCPTGLEQPGARVPLRRQSLARPTFLCTSFVCR